MTLLLTLALSLIAKAAETPKFPSNPFENKCSTPAATAIFQKAIIKNLRARVKKEQNGNNAFTFKFTAPYAASEEKPFATSIYLETVGEEETSRRGYVAQYALDLENCAPSFKKMQLLVGGTDGSAERMNGMRDQELCNFGNGQDSIIKGLVRDAKWLTPQNAPGSTAGNFAFTGVSRVEGTTDVVGIYETTQAGRFSTAILIQASVDEKTCEPKMLLSTSFARTAVDY
ncbi:MAG: hypothetical protein EOP11_00240 [Proteobacteria bacterium]|nr:MAG: hypothetical protein EOP11_00240 [Pseudomonadota bacterium]